MAQYSMFSDEMLSEALESKNKISIVNFVIQTINYNNSFSNGEYDKLIETIRKKFPEAIELKAPVDGEYYLREDEWDDDYFKHLLFNLRSNFCNERIEEIETVGKALFSRNIKEPKNNANPTFPQPAQKVVAPIQNRTKTGTGSAVQTLRNKKRVAILMAIAVTILIIGIACKYSNN